MSEVDFLNEMGFKTDGASDSLINAMFGAYIGLTIVGFIAAIFLIVCTWIMFKKANEPGWGAIVPFYNSYLLFKITFGNGWLFLLLLIPFVNVIVAIILNFKLAEVYGHGIGFGFGLLFLTVIFYGILAFGKSEYVGIKKEA